MPRQLDRYRFVQWFHELPEHPAVIVGARRDDGGEEESGEHAYEPCVLRVRRPELTPPPAPPAQLLEWVQRWSDPEHDPRVRDFLERPGPDGETMTIGFRDDPNRPTIFSRWLDAWRNWAAREGPTRRAALLFERLFSLHTALQREGEHFELVLGDGILAWQQDTAPVHHPILLQSLQLEFDSSVPEFTLVETERPAELHTTLFREFSTVSPAWLGELRAEMEAGGHHPLGGGTTSDFLRRVAGRLSSKGRFTENGAVLRAGAEPVVGRAPVIFMRDRAQGFAAFIERVVAHIQSGVDLPPTLCNVVGFPVEEAAVAQGRTYTAPGEEPAHIFFSKVANPEQIRAAEYLEHHHGVLVQGPPGTGKTHTIGNLLGHLLAQGKSVLVTSHTSKALRVLRDQVVEPLRPLCVSVLDSETRSQDELQHAVHTIVARLGGDDADRLEREAVSLTERRDELLRRLHDKKRVLITARAAEYEDLVVDGTRYEPSEAARLVAAGSGSHDWIPAPVVASVPMPLDIEEVGELYRTSVALAPADEDELADPLPPLEWLLVPADFQSLLSTRGMLAARVDEALPDLWERPPAAGDESRLEGVTTALEQALHALGDGADWALAVVAAGMRGEAERRPWEDFLHRISVVVERSRKVQPKLLEHGPELPADLPLATQITILEEIRAHVRSGGSLSGLRLLMKPRWKALLAGCRVDGAAPSTADHVEALLGLARLREDRDALLRRWDRFIAAQGGPRGETLGPEPERTAGQYAERIRHLLSWADDVWHPAELGARSAGVRWDAFVRSLPPNPGVHGDLVRLRDGVRDRLLPVLHARADLARLATLEQKLQQARAQLAPFARGVVADRLRSAVEEGDPVRYAAAYRRLLELLARKPVLEKRAALLSKMKASAPEWAARVRAREGVHGDERAPGNPQAAWLWRQLHDELERRSAASPEQLQAEVERLRGDLHEVTAELIERRAWAAQMRRTGPRERQALMGYRDAVKRIGRGLGKRAPVFRAEAQRLMTECRGAVPVWIMPLSRVVDTFDPRRTHFDVVVIDEASQCDVMGLLAFSLGTKVLVVGDDEQVSPAAVGQEVTVVHRLIDEHLEGIPNRKLYDGQMSVYELAQQSFTRTLRLVEHFRCVPDIIEFSNQLSYDGKITPLRDAAAVSLRPHVVEHAVAGGSEDRQINEVEALEVTSLIAAAVEQPEYRGKTFGVISLLGDGQALRIEKLLRDHLEPHVMDEHQVLCGNAAQFQGDERDVMFLSMVKSRSSRGPLALMGEGYLGANKKRFNVAASRARDQMWVVHSLTPATDLKHGDLRLRLIKHAQNPNALTEILRRGQSRTESEFERQVHAALVHRGYRVTPQWWVGYYRIDLVVHGAGGAMVAVECDGDRYHPREKLEEDMARQALLERLGWRFVRLRGTQYFRQPERTMEHVFSQLRALGLEPAAEERPTDEPVQATELLERVRRRAAELRAEWRPVSAQPPAPTETLADVLPFTGIVPEQENESLSDDSVPGDAEGVAAAHSAACPVCLRENQLMVLFRGKEICTECTDKLQRDTSAVPRPRYTVEV